MERLLILSALTALAAVGCRFDTAVSASGNRGDDAGPEVDGDPSAPDASQSTPDAAFCDGFVSAHFDACLIGSPSAGLDLSMSGTYTYKTDDGVLEDPIGTAVEHQSITIDLGGVTTRIISVDSLTLAAAAILRGEGSMPLVIASWGSIEILGTIDFDSARGGTPGAGANPALCDQDGPAVGGSDSSGGGGGGGGGFGGNGGAGGNGDNNGTGSSGGAGGIGPTQTPTTVRGGCASAGGGDGLSSAAEGSAGGGAIQLTSKTMLTINGGIFAGGAGGRGGPTDSRAGGSGGGSGGYIGLQAPIIEISDGAQIFANGGGGGEGTSSSRTGANGQNSRHSLQRASGGDGNSEFGTSGGQGGAIGTLEGESVIGSLASGGGGGGGGAGFVLLWTPDFGGTNAQISPAATSL